MPFGRKEEMYMSQVQEVTNDLVTAISKSAEYVRYLNAKKKIFQYPVLKKKADEYRRLNYELQNGSADIFQKQTSCGRSMQA